MMQMMTMTPTSVKTPPQQQPSFCNPFDFEPCAPHASRTTIDLSRRILGNLENLCAPTLSASTMDARRMNQPTTMSARRQSPNFDAALDRMKNGSTLQRLQQERIHMAQLSREQEATHRLRSLCMEPSEKGVTNPTVQLGRQAPERRSSGTARSA